MQSENALCIIFKCADDDCKGIGPRLTYTPQRNKVTAKSEKNVSNSIVKVDNMNVRYK